MDMDEHFFFLPPSSYHDSFFRFHLLRYILHVMFESCQRLWCFAKWKRGVRMRVENKIK